MSEGLFELDPGADVLVARVHLDIDLMHLDHPLDYVIPDDLVSRAVVGALVKVRLAGRPHQGWIVDTCRIHPGQRRLQPLLGIVSAGPVLTPALYQLASAVAQRSVSTLSQVLSLAIPTRHAGTEKRFFEATPPLEFSSLHASVSREDLPTSVDSDTDAVPEDLLCEVSRAWNTYAYGESFILSLARADAPRAVWNALPGHRDDALAGALRIIRQRQHTSICVTPTQAQARDLHAAVIAADPHLNVVVYHSDLNAAQRYEIYLQSLAGEFDVIIGTRSAMWLPVKKLGLIVIWDSGDDRLREQRSPRVDVVDVALQRVRIDHCAVLIGAWTRSVKTHMLVESGWAHPLEAPWEQRRALLPRIEVEDEFTQQREGVRSSGQLTLISQQKIRDALTRGPVLVHVPQSGFVPRVACQNCRELSRCSSCHGQLSVTKEQRIMCSWCAREVTGWVCPHCSGTHLRAVRIGSDLTGEHLGRVFPGIPLVMSTAVHDVTDTLDRKPRLVVATPGREPRVEGGYELVVIVDAPAIAQRPELWAQEEALRRWMNALALLSPAGAGYITGGMDTVLSQSLIRWDPTYLAHHLLEERRELQFFPAATVISLDGASSDVHRLIGKLECDVMGVVERSEDSDDSEAQVRALLRAHRHGTPELIDRLRVVQQERAAKKMPLIRITVNPPELF